MGKYQGYEKYKDSGVEWLGEIPDHWEASQLGYLATIKARLGWKGLTASEYINDGYIFLATPNIKSEDGIDFQNVNYISAERYFESPEIMLQEDDVLLAKDGSTLGIVNIVKNLPSPATVNSSIAVIRIVKKINSKFLFHWLKSFYIQSIIQLMKGGQGVPHLFQADIKRFSVLIPPIDEQESIACFLDRKTSQIDALIAKKSALLEKLDEKRTALISHAVTKGLDSSVPMKDSGVEWLGDIPEHWDLLPMKRFAEIYDCKHKTVSFVDDGLPVASIAQVQKFYIDLSTANKTTEEEFMEMIEGGRKPRNGDIILSRNATVGASAIVRNDNFCMGQDVCLIRPIEAHSLFLNYNFYSFFVKTQIDNCLLGSTFKRINVEKVKNLIICLPSLAEQEKITSFIVDKTAEIDRQKAKVKEAIELLKEYRTALITNAVTGKIDVRQVARV